MRYAKVPAQHLPATADGRVIQYDTIHAICSSEVIWDTYFISALALAIRPDPRVLITIPQLNHSSAYFHPRVHVDIVNWVNPEMFSSPFVEDEFDVCSQVELLAQYDIIFGTSPECIDLDACAAARTVPVVSGTDSRVPVFEQAHGFQHFFAIRSHCGVMAISDFFIPRRMV